MIHNVYSSNIEVKTFWFTYLKDFVSKWIQFFLFFIQLIGFEKCPFWSFNKFSQLMRFETIPGAYAYNESYFKNQFKIGQQIKVKILSTNVKNGEINFAYVSKINYNKKGGKNNEKINKQ